MKKQKGAVLIEVLVGLFITAIVFIGVYTTISVSLVNTKYLQQARETSGFACQYAEALMASSDCEEYSIFDYVKAKHGNAFWQMLYCYSKIYKTQVCSVCHM